MVMSFQNQQVLNFLLARGVVYTFRVKKRKHLGKDWINAKRGLPKIANVNVHFVKDVKVMRDLEPYIENSGFGSLQEWLDAILDLAGETVYNGLIYDDKHRSGVLYRVSLAFGGFASRR